MAFTEAELRAYRDSLARRLSSTAHGGEPFAYLVAADDAGLLLHLRAHGLPLVLLFGGETDEALAELRARAQRVAASMQGEGCHVAVIGGGERVRSLLAELDLGGRASLHHVTVDGAVWDRGEALGALSHAARELVETGALEPPLDPDEVARTRAQFEAAASAEQAFARSLSRGTTRVTTAIVVTCVALFGLKLLWGGSLATDLRMGAVDGLRLRAGDWWRPLSGMFLHGSVLHVGVNMWSLWSMGRFFERLLGSRRFLVLYAAAGLFGGLASSLFHPDVPSVGASGAIFGLLGAQVGLAFHKGRLLPPTVAASLKRNLWTPILANAAISFLPGVDALAHAGGALAGLGLVASGALLSGLPESDDAPRTDRWTMVASLTGAALIVALAGAMLHGRPWELAGTPSLASLELAPGALSMQLPRGVAVQKLESEGGAVMAVVGDLSRDPLTVSVLATPTTETEPDSTDLAELSAPVERIRLDNGPAAERIGDAEALWVRLILPDGDTVIRAISYRGGRRYQTIFRFSAGLSPAWEASFRPMLASLGPP